jgi:hypothetical protein
MHALRTTWRTWVALLSALLLSSCGRYWVCGAVDPGAAHLPQRLSETGLYANIAAEELAPGVVPYTPRFPLWSDGSDKRRWIWLPPGTSIDTSNMDDWIFPEGTKLWKEFSLEGTRLETRLLQKNGPGEADWSSLAYVWNAEETDALAAPLGEVDTKETAHDVPAAGECVACHGGRRSYVLGFSAIQLAGPALADDLDLDGVVARGWLSAPPAPRPVVPGNATEVAALGYLHANCSHCHNQTRPARAGARCFNPEDDQDFTLRVASLASVEATPTYRTVVGHAVQRGAPDDSKLYRLITSRGFFRQMPPLATEKVDADAAATIRAWIEGL